MRLLVIGKKIMLMLLLAENLCTAQAIYLGVVADRGACQQLPAARWVQQSLATTHLLHLKTPQRR